MLILVGAETSPPHEDELAIVPQRFDKISSVDIQELNIF